MSKKILSVDDSKMVHMVISKALQAYDITLLTASNGEEGLAKAKQELPEVIILDITMPVMDGIETLAKLRQDPATQSVPVLMLSADSAKASMDMAMELGASNFLSKPFTPAALIGALERFGLPLKAT